MEEALARDAAKRLGGDVEWVDKIHTRTVIQFDWLDRLRILFGRRVYVHTTTHTVVPIETCKAETAHVYVDRIIPESPKAYTEAPQGTRVEVGGQMHDQRMLELDHTTLWGHNK